MCVFKYHAFIFYMRPPRWRYGTVLAINRWILYVPSRPQLKHNIQLHPFYSHNCHLLIQALKLRTETVGFILPHPNPTPSYLLKHKYLSNCCDSYCHTVLIKTLVTPNVMRYLSKLLLLLLSHISNQNAVTHHLWKLRSFLVSHSNSQNNCDSYCHTAPIKIASTPTVTQYLSVLQCFKLYRHTVPIIT
jgi:hypothetical protein